MNFRNLFFLFFLALLVSCTRDAMQDEVVITDNQEMMRSSGSVDDAVMFRGSHLNGKAVERTLTFRDLTGIYTYEPPDGTGMCPEYFKFTSRGKGLVTHLGLSTLLSSWCVSGPYGSPIPDGPKEGGVWAANGDKLYTDRTASYPSEEYEGYYCFEIAILGGTGRFIGATGAYKIYVAITPDEPPVDPETGILSGTWIGFGNGTITY